MKYPSQHRFPVVSDCPDDWGGGSWTVDCICGVTFDDGAEMVNCDECSVWVHTRCSRFVRGEESFACHKCKSRKAPGDSSKETEVAQLLVDLPTKTIQMDGRLASVQRPPPRPPCPLFKRLWIPMEERVHAHGVPGGDPALFHGMSSVFSPELWKCAGYVPKKFNFQYKEFPWQEDGEKDVEKQRVNAKRDDEEDKENAVDRGADVLFSLSKETIRFAPSMGAVGGLRGYDDGRRGETKSPLKEMKRRDWEKGGLNSGCVQTCVNREKNQIQPVGLPSGKWKTKELGISKERSGKKKSRSADKEVDGKKIVVSAPAPDAHRLNILEHGGFKVGNSTDYQDTKSKDDREAEPNYECHLEAPFNGSKPKPTLFTEATAEIFCDGAYKRNFSPEPLVKVENIDHQAPIRNGISPRADASGTSLTETKGIGKVSIKDEDLRSAVEGLNHLRDESYIMADLNKGSSSVSVDSQKSKPPDVDQRSATQDVNEICTLPGSNGAVSMSFVHTNGRSKIEACDGDKKRDPELLHSVGDGTPVLVSNSLQHFARFNGEISKNLQVHDMPAANFLSGEHSSTDAERVLDLMSCHDTIAEGTISTSDKLHHCEQEYASPLTGAEGCLKPRQGGKCIEKPLKLEARNPSPPAPGLRKLVVGIGKSASSTLVFSKPSISGNSKSMRTVLSPEAIKPNHSSKPHVKIKLSTAHKKDNVAISVPSDVSKQEVPEPVKDCPKSPANCGLKQPHASRTYHSSTSKHSMPDAKVQQMPCSSKESIAQNVAKFLGTVDCSSLSQTQITSQNKLASSSNQKNEKINQSSFQQSSKEFNHSSSVHPPPPAPVHASATLSDEKFALLLHQELNSSPRVPRAARIRHNLPQLSSPKATSMLVKCTHSSGGKDPISVSRRKNKEVCKDNSRNLPELADGSKKASRFSSSPDQKQQASVFTTDGLIKRDSCNRSPDAVASTKKNVPLKSSTLSGYSSSMEANDQTLSFIRSSSRDISDDDVGGVSGSTYTLPGLIDKIMSKDKRMTYEDLCAAVLPYWHNLRKHNEECYAHSSHSQAVLDCLRNRNEWAELIDRGPKTSSSSKRRMSDADTSTFDSEKEDAKDRPINQIEGISIEPHREESPKGRRKARKRRRLQLRNRVLKEFRKQHQKMDAATDEDFGAYSSEGCDRIFSEDENMGARTGEASV
ncbi:zinc finger protein [Cinnamomum micranthum f. kanehirae]|uniref:Zinc finger protein n=1 Tax=Cinnamomum micranthum f. kanehirae TaxID=337451 RepID=A0A3S3QLX3_9MAGN|nr:zinc finger protein [Cinnamomum micranthum f. kanehirae]